MLRSNKLLLFEHSLFQFLAKAFSNVEKKVNNVFNAINKITNDLPCCVNWRILLVILGFLKVWLDSVGSLQLSHDNHTFMIEKLFAFISKYTYLLPYFIVP